MRQTKAWTEERLREAVATSTTFTALLKRMGLKPGSRRYLQEEIRKLGLDVSHYKTGLEKKLCSDDRLRELVTSSKSATDILRTLGVELHSNNFYKLRRRIGLLGLDTSHFIRERGDRVDGHTRWSNDDLRRAVASSRSYAQAIRSLGIIPAGGNYETVRRRISELGIDTSHFTSKGWNKGLFTPVPAFPLEKVLVAGRWTSSHGLKKRLINEGLKKAACELCGWAERAPDGRIPIELDHINGDKTDNRLENLRIVCPNCHSLQPTHRGLNKQTRRKKRTEAAKPSGAREAHWNGSWKRLGASGGT